MSRHPAVSPLGVLCRRRLKAQFRGFWAISCFLILLSQRSHLALSETTQRVHVVRKWERCMLFSRPHRAPGGTSCPLHDPPVSRRRCGFGPDAACWCHVDAYCHGRAACDARPSVWSGSATCWRGSAASTASLSARPASCTGAHGPSFIPTRTRPECSPMSVSPLTVCADQGDLSVRTSLPPPAGAWSGGGVESRLTVPGTPTRARQAPVSSRFKWAYCSPTAARDRRPLGNVL